MPVTSFDKIKNLLDQYSVAIVDVAQHHISGILVDDFDDLASDLDDMLLEEYERGQKEGPHD